MADDRCLVVIEELRKLWESTGEPMENLGLRMGYPKRTARASVSQFFCETADPRLSMVLRFADAMGISLADIFQEIEERMGDKL